MKHWMNIVLPPRWVLVVMTGSYLLLLLVPHLVFRSDSFVDQLLTEELHRAMLVWLGLCAVAYAAFRIFVFHPVFNSEYREWLSRTPWSYGKSLPNGPLQLVLQDAIVVGILALLGFFHDPAKWFVIPAVFVSAHATFSGFSFGHTRQLYHAYLIVFLLTGWFYFYEQPRLLLTLSISLWFITRWGIRESLQKIHKWNADSIRANLFLVTSTEKAQELKREQLLGWPHDRTGPIQSGKSPPLGCVASVSVLVGWWVYRVFHLIPDFPDAEHFLLCLMLWIGSWIPTALCLSGYASPLTLWGRLSTGRLIIPSYDKIFLSPLVNGIVLLNSLIIAMNFPNEISINAGLTSILTILLTSLLFPDLQTWRLTGYHRIVPGIGVGQQELQQTQ